METSAINFNSVIWFLTLIMTTEAQTFCTTQSSSPAGAPTLPVFTDSYEARIEVNILDKNYSMVIDEYLDYEGNRAALTTHKTGITETFIFSYNTNEVFDIIDQSCKVETVDNNPYNFLLGPNANSTGGKRHAMDSGTSLKFTAANHPVYNGTGTVRGIPVNIWTVCLAWPNAVGNVRATYSFSALSWNTSSPGLQTLLQIEVEGMSSAPSNSGPGITTSKPATPRHFHHVYDFIRYLPFIADSDPSVFQTPPEVVCVNRTNVKSLPSFQSHFKYKAEIIDSTDLSITYYSIWYDEDLKMVREDYRIDPSSASGVDVLTTTEIHDFNTGVRYIIDPVSGCTEQPIDPRSTDSQQDVSRFHFNDTMVVDIRDPNSFFVLNYNYTFTEQRKVRGIVCDIYSAIIPNYVLEDAVTSAIYEYAFLADGWNDIPLYSSELDAQNYPVQLVITVPLVKFTRIYNFFEFAEEPMTYPIFDISACFDENQKFDFQLTFPGVFTTGSQEQWTNNTYSTLLSTMQVFPIRVSGITVTNDDDNVYVNAFVLGSAVTAQFEKTNITLERMNNELVKGITMLDECAALCIDHNNTDFICESFQFCPNDGFACGLSKNHRASNSVPANATACDEYARTVEVGPKREPTLREAYNSLQTAVTQKKFQITIKDNQGNNMAPFTAINVELLSGEVVADKPLPTLPSAFSYRMEIADAKTTSVHEFYIWYDESMGLVRYDTRDPAKAMPYLTTYIHDFNTGVAYKIDKVMEECTESPIASSDVFDVAAGTITNGGLIVTMKTPNSLFFLDDTYTYIGQGTARRIPADVYESRRGDYNDEYRNTSAVTTVFKYFFQDSSWTYTSPLSTSSTPVKNQPIKLTVEDKVTGDYLIYSFYDFTEQHFGSNFFDTSVCYDPAEIKSFIITFKDQQYHPVLDLLSEDFLKNAVDKMSKLTFLSPMHFQQVSLTYDDSDVYLIATALGHASQINLFTSTMKVGHNATANQTYAATVDDCASACITTSMFACNSFDYCVESPGPNCLLGAQHSESEGDPSNSEGLCTHFSRTENATSPGMSMQQMYSTLLNTVYEEKFSVTVTFQNGTNVTYTATSIRDDIQRPTDPAGTEGSYLQKFVSNPGFKLNDSLIAQTNYGVSVADCAMSCIVDNVFTCQSFDYQFTLGTCRLSNSHPDEFGNINASESKNAYTTVYSRFYTEEYDKYDADMYDTHADKVIPNVKSDELCARACTSNTDFVCEAFEMCTDGSCQLQKTHIIVTNPSSPDSRICTHYSRNHIYDYTPRPNKVIKGHDNITISVEDASACAQLCSTGEGLPSCASFQVCQIQERVMLCTMTVADPTTQKDVKIVDSGGCTLYTRTNSPSSVAGLPAAPPINVGAPAAGTGTKNPVAVKDGNICAAQPAQSSDTGTRVGLAFGTLILGLLVGAGCMILFIRIRFGKYGHREDATVLKTWDN